MADDAFEAGILSRTRRTALQTLAPGKLLRQADGKDIIKKSSARKGRYLLNICAQLQPIGGGQMGALAQLDTPHPVLYLHFPGGGRLKLFGDLVFPTTKHAVLRVGPGGVLCEDVLENMIVFHTAWWIGTAADNPGELKLPMPEGVLAPGPGDAAVDWADVGPLAAPPAGAAPGHPASRPSASASASDASLGPSQRPARASQRRAAAGRARYVESDGEGGDGGSDEVGASGGGGRPGPGFGPRMCFGTGDGGLPPPAPPGTALPPLPGLPPLPLGAPAAPSPRPAAKRPPPRSSGGAPKKRRAASSDEDEGEWKSDDDDAASGSGSDGDNDDGGSRPTQSTRGARPPRQAAARPCVRVVESASPSEGGGRPSAGGGGDDDGDGFASDGDVPSSPSSPEDDSDFSG